MSTEISSKLLVNGLRGQGQRKVGTASELPLARRAQLAVVAHIRHIYTEYDRLLRTTSFHEARTAVEEPTLAKLVEWRGDDENGRTILEDVFREVIVISDDDDSETEEEAAPASGTRDYSVEILSSQARAHEIQPQQVRTAKPGQDPLREFSDDEAPPGFRVVARAPAKKTIDRRGFSRYQAWDRALSRYRAGASGTGPARLGGIPNEQRAPQYARRPAAPEAAGAGRHRDIAPHGSNVSPRTIPGHIDNQPQPIPVASAETRVSARGPFVSSDSQRNISNHGSNGKAGLTFREPHELHLLGESRSRNADAVQLQGGARSVQDRNPRSERFPIQPNDRVDAPVFVSGPKKQPQSSDTHSGRRPGSAPFHRTRPVLNSQDTVLPSIENPWPPESSHADGRLDHLTKRMSGGLSLRSVTPGRPHGEAFCHDSNVDLDNASDQTSKRRRLAYYGSSRDPHADSWNPRTVAAAAPERIVPGGQSRRVAMVPEPRSAGQEKPLIRRDYLPVEQPCGVGHQRDKNPSPFGHPLHAIPNARLMPERKRIGNPHDPVSKARPQVLPSYVVPEGERTFRTVPNVPTPGARLVYHGDRSPHLDRLRPVMEQPPSWGHVDEVSQGRRIYADDFVRHVDIREMAQPVARRPGLGAKHVEELAQPTQARIAGQRDPVSDRFAMAPRVCNAQERAHNPDHELPRSPPRAHRERRVLSSTR